MDLLGDHLDCMLRDRVGQAVGLWMAGMGWMGRMLLFLKVFAETEGAGAPVILLEQVEPVAMVGIRVGVVDPVREGPLLAVRGAEGHMVV